MLRAIGLFILKHRNKLLRWIPRIGCLIILIFACIGLYHVSPQWNQFKAEALSRGYNPIKVAFILVYMPLSAISFFTYLFLYLLFSKLIIKVKIVFILISSIIAAPLVLEILAFTDICGSGFEFFVLLLILSLYLLVKSWPEIIKKEML